MIVCLVGGGQEINTGEAGITEWVRSLVRRFPTWHLHISPKLDDAEYAAGGALEEVKELPTVRWNEELHLGVSMRSFRAERLSLLVKQLLDLDEAGGRVVIHAEHGATWGTRSVKVRCAQCGVSH